MTLRVLVYEPFGAGRGEIREVPSEMPASLDAMQAIVGGYIEMVPLNEDRTLFAVVNEEGLLKGLPLNRYSGRLGFVGTFFVTRVSGEDNVSLSDEDVLKARMAFDVLYS